MASDDRLDIEGNISRLDLESGDIVVFTPKQELTDQQMQSLGGFFNRAGIPRVHLLIVRPGDEFEVIRKTGEPA